MMISNMKFIPFALVIITIFSEGKSESRQNVSFLQNDLINYLFPKNPNLVRVRKMEEATETNSAKVLDFVGLVEQYGYPAEEHNLITEDGYNLIIHRIPGSPLLNNNRKKEVVFLQHGILASSDSWVLFGPDKDLAFLLADQGYDVWIGNVRGNAYCRSHVEMTIYDRKFWQYSFHNIGIKDLPAMFDYIFNYTGQTSLYYIGHSMGTTVLFVLLSVRPEYNAKIKVAVCLAPISVWMETTSTLKDFINIFPTMKEFLEKYEIYDILPQSLMTITIGKTLCNDKAMTQAICVALIFLAAGSDPAQLNTTALPYIISHFPAGISIQTVNHYYQNMVANDFRNYDYGVVGNNERYKQKTPPSYELKKITAPIILFYAANDILIPKQNVYELSKRLSNVILMEEIPYKLFNHMDFMWAIDAKTLLYDRVLEVIQNFDANQNITMK